MILASLLTDDIYRHQNGLKHINIDDNEGFSALFVVNTPVVDNSGVAHAVEHMVFRGSDAFPKPETLFQLTSLTDAKINASTFANTTYFHCHSQCSHTFMLALNYLLNGLFNPVFNEEDLNKELCDGNTGGVIYRELLGSEALNEKATQREESEFSYGGTSTLIGELSINDLSKFHQRFYQAENITLVTANANVEQISRLISLLPKQEKQTEPLKANDDTFKAVSTIDENNHNKYPKAVKKLISTYLLWLQDPYYQEIDDYVEIDYSKETGNKEAFMTDKAPPFLNQSSQLIPSLTALANRLTKDDATKKSNTNKTTLLVQPSIKPTVLPNLFKELCQQGIKKLNNKQPPATIELAYEFDQYNALWLTKTSDTEKTIADITSYIISAYPEFLSVRCQGSCYATQALTIENSAYLAIYFAFDMTPSEHAQNISKTLLKLSQDCHFISMSLALAKLKYCRIQPEKSSQVKNIPPSDVSAYLLALANRPHPKV